MNSANAGGNNTDNPGVLKDLGDIGIKLLKEENWTALIAHCQEWTKAEPENDVAWWLLGKAHQSMSCFHEAIEAYRMALSLFPPNVEVWESLIIAYNAVNERDAAIAAVRELRKYDSKKADEYLNFLIAEGKKFDPERNNEYLDRFIAEEKRKREKR